jgi:hypothetical protein
MTEPARNASGNAAKATTQLQALGDRATETGRQFGTLVINTYEQTVASFVEFEHRAAAAVHNDLMKAAIQAHAEFVDDINGAYIKAMREALPR